MRMIPPQQYDGATGSERRVFSLLRQDIHEPEAVALSALNLSEHEYQRWGELDFVVVSPQGLLAIEVKGGLVTCKDGIWRFEDGWGRAVERSVAPLAQAQGGYSSLLGRFLRPKFGGPFIEKAVTGFCVVFPGTTKRNAQPLIGGTEAPPELVGVAEDCQNSASFRWFVNRVFSYWRSRQPRARSGWAGSEIRDVVGTLRPSFDRVEPLSISLARLRNEQLALTEDQYRLLDYLETSQRILCTGSAGTGKTFLAVECLRREASNNPILITGTKSLADHLRGENVPDARRIASYHEIEQNPSAYVGKFDTLIVDEGQQITNDAAIEVLSRILRTPFNNARWRWFCDPHFQLTSSSRFDPQCQSKLRSAANATATLKDNCRNTPQIVRAVEFAVGVPIGTTRVKGAGPEVAYGHSSSWDGLTAEAAKQIAGWLEDGNVRSGQIMLLSAGPLERSQARNIAARCGLGLVRWHRGWDCDANTLGFCTIEEFRGLESPFVVLTDLTGGVEELASMIYLGMTRANFAVFVACDSKAREALVNARAVSRTA